MLGVVVQIDGYDPGSNSAVTIYAASSDDPAVCHLNGQTWWPALLKLPTLRYDLFDGAFGGEISAPAASLKLNVEAWPNFGRYLLADARFRLWTGNIGDGWGSWTLRFDGRVTEQPEGEGDTVDVSFAVDDRWLDAALLNTYAGTTGAEGSSDLKGQAKPLSLGAPRYVPGTLVDQPNSVFQVSGYGAINAFDAALEKLARYGAPAADYASYAALVGASIAPGTWATAKAVGMARFGAPPAGQISFLVRGDTAGPNGWARKPGELIRRLALLSGGTDKIADVSLNALDTARPYNVSVYLDQQTTARPLIQSLAASVNAVAGVSWTGKLFVAAVAIGAQTLALAADGTALPPVTGVKQVSIASPFKKLTIGAERAVSVHALADIAFTATLVDMGAYAAGTTYREGNIVQSNGSSWLYVSSVPSAGNAPPDPPAESNGYWKVLAKGGLSAAQAQAINDAQAAIAAIRADNVLSTNEKREIIVQYTAIANEQSTLVAQANARGVSATNLQAKQSALASYLGGLSPAWNDVSTDTPIDGPTFSSKFTDYYQAKIALLTAIDQASATTATWDGVTGAGKDALIASANASAAEITAIAADGVLSRSEKSATIKEYNAIAAEQSTLVAQANSVGVSPSTLQSKQAALANYLGGLNPAWNDTTTNTNINATDFRAAFNDYYTAKISLITAIDEANKTAAANALTSANNAAGQAAAAQTAIGRIQSDGYLSAGEKPDVIRLINDINNEYAPNVAAAVPYSVDSSTYTAGKNALITYITGLNPPYTDTTTDTQIVANTFNTKFSDYFIARQNLLNAIAFAASDWAYQRGDAKPGDYATSGPNLIPGPVRLERALTTAGATRQNTGVNGANRDANRIRFDANNNGIVYWEPGTTAIKLVVGEMLFYQCDVNIQSGSNGYVWHVIQFVGNNGEFVSNTVVSAATYSTANGLWATVGGTLVVPAGAAACRVYTQRVNGTAGLAYAANPYLGRSASGADITAQSPYVSKLDANGQATSRRLNTQFTVGGAGQVYLVNGVPDNPLRSSVASNGTVTISILAHSVVDDAGTISYSAGSITGAPQNTDVYVFEDSNFVGGARTYQYTGNPQDLAATATRRYVGAIHTATGAAGSTGDPGTGGGGSGIRCVAADSWLPDGRQARDVAVGDALIALDYGSMRAITHVSVLAVALATRPCVEIEVASGERVRVSVETDVTYRDGSVGPVLEALGRDLPVMGGSETEARWERVVALHPIGEHEVIAIDAGGATFAAGIDGSGFVFTHNKTINQP